MKAGRLLYLIFFLSGATGLVYEVIWVRLTGLVFGNTAHAIATVLGAFMAGLALGSWKLGQQSDKLARPLRGYGILEICIGISAALVPIAFRSLDTVYWAIAPSVETLPGGSAAIRFIASFIVLVIPTFLMGGTLPMLTRFFTENVGEVERKVGLLYALNTFGAALGTMVAALYLIPEQGTTRTTLIIASINIAIGVFSIWLDSRAVNQPVEESGETSSQSEALETNSTTLSPTAARLVLLTLAASGFVSMTYEVAWTRALASLMGSSTYAFSIMLVTFLTGIALGSTYVSRRRPAVGIGTLGLIQLGVAVGGFIFLAGYVVAPYVILALVRALSYSFPAIVTTQFVVCSLLMIVATLFTGATFPIASQMASSRLTVLGRTVGNIYSINTVGAILGSLVAGFVLLPLLGTERTLLAGLFLNAALALLLLSEGAAGKRMEVPNWAAVVLLAVATLSMRGGIFWHRDMMDRGVLIYAQEFDRRPELSIAEHYADTDVVYFEEGNNASISVRKGEDYLALRTNGKVDASNRDDMMTQLAVAYLAGFYHPSPKDALIIGYGSGVTVGAATAIPELQNIDCLEIEPAVFQAGSFFSSINRKSYENAKVHVTYNDARNFMNMTRKQYDIIVSEPSNPWIAGVASLFTAEFYDRAVEVLKPDGVFVQWVQLYELDPEDLRMILSEVQRRFPEVSVWNTGIGDLILIGTRTPQHLDLGRVRKIVNGDPSIAKDFRDYLKLSSPDGILAYYVMSTEQVRALAANARRNTDARPLLEFHAPRQLYADTKDLNVELLYQRKVGLLPSGAEVPDPEATYGAMIEPLLLMDHANLANQAMGLLAQVPNRNPASLPLAIARLKLSTNDYAGARHALSEASKNQKTSDPLYAATEELWGSLEAESGDFEEAIRHFANSAQADPKRDLPPRKLAEIFASRQKWPDAAHWMRQYVELTPRNAAHYWAMLGDYALAAEDPDNAVKAMQTALAMDPYTYWAHYRMARMFESRKESADAVKQYEFILQYAFDQDADVYLNLANIYRASGNEKEARRVLAKGKRMFPTNAAIYRLYRDVGGED